MRTSSNFSFFYFVLFGERLQAIDTVNQDRISGSVRSWFAHIQKFCIENGDFHTVKIPAGHRT